MKYLHYFFYLAGNWNISIACHLIREEIHGEKKYGIDTTGADELKKMEENGIDISHATIYMPASFSLLETFFQKIQSKHLVDIGSGKGRTLCVAAHSGILKVTGIDFNRSFCEVAKKNLSITKNKYPQLKYNIINNDAFYFEIPDDADCIFLFNPFDEMIMSGVVDNISASLKNNPRELTVIYFNPLLKHLFLQKGFTEIFHTKKLHYLEGIILKSPAK